jgi:putative endonuclease
MKGKRKFGTEAENRAADYLSQKGYQILERGYYFGHKEIDLICKSGNTIVFVEVKAARTEKFGEPQSWVTKSKQKNLIKAAQGYIWEHNVSGCDFRFDVIAYKRIGNDVRLSHFEGAFYIEENP